MKRKPTEPSTKGVAYLRVSTSRQGKSGLGLEAQREAIARYAQERGLTIIAEFEEVETGKGANALTKRPQLLAALTLAKRERAKLIIAKLDRLARNVAFVAGLMEQGVDFVFTDMPEADRMMLQIYAAVAEQEGRAISDRTHKALQAAKARGVVLGANGKALAAANKAEALERLASVAPVIAELQAEGLSMRAIVATLNDRGVPSPGGGKWHLANLHRAMKRAA